MTIPRPRLLRLLVAIGSLCALVLLFDFRTSLLRAAGWALVVEDPLGRADVVVLPQWAGDAGALEAADLVRAGFAPRVVVLVGPHGRATDEMVRRRILTPGTSIWQTQLTRALGVQTIEEIPNPIDGTDAEGELLPDLSARYGFHSIIIVSAADHSRRVRRVVHRSMKGRNINVMVRFARYSGFEPDRWWKTRDGTRTEIVELQKLLFDIIRHPIS